jgi:hypothetical protein
MSVERRYTQRVPVNLPVRVNYREQARISARARNVSAEGMYLSGEGPQMPSGILVSLQLAAGGRDWQIEALVVHSDSPGIGLLFVETQQHLYSEIAAARGPLRFAAAG